MLAISGGDQEFPAPGTQGFYTALFNYYNWLYQDSPLKYVGAVAGDGNWSDAGHWVQHLDPSWYMIDESGNIVNGIPTHNVMNMVTGEEWDQDAGQCGNFSGPGATGFVLNNSHGSHGVAFENCATYFEVNLNQSATTTVDIDVEIDRLRITNADAFLDIDTGMNFSTLLDTTVEAGVLNIDGTFSAQNLLNSFGVVTGTGSINIDHFSNGGMIATGGAGTTGALAINGDLSMSTNSILATDYINGSSDLLDVNGDALLNGVLSLNFGETGPQYGDEFTILRTSGDVLGAFSNVTDLAGVLYAAVDYNYNGTAPADSVDVRIEAASFADFISSSATDNHRASALALDNARSENHSGIRDFFSAIDRLEGQALNDALETTRPAINSDSANLFGSLTTVSLAHISDRVSGLTGASLSGFSSNSNPLQNMRNKKGGSVGELANLAAKGHRGNYGGSTTGDNRIFGSISMIQGDYEGLNNGDMEGYVATIGIDPKNSIFHC